ncbi:beta C1 [Ageratum yellow vein virus defective satellite DNA beta]|uniref:Beta C1 n=1 Tax=Ageratum yellow vein virus defective satellite DNA beta TaxID=593999 RepID=B9VUA4_9VIRU|nr:beta C1 [Ageratum yellow vein virus defective satellite DNA beta]
MRGFHNALGIGTLVPLYTRLPNGIIVILKIEFKFRIGKAAIRIILPDGRFFSGGPSTNIYVQGIIPPFNFNALEEGIKNILRIMYRDSTIEEFKSEDMVEIIDIMMQQEAPVLDIQVNDEYHVYKNVTV